MNLRPLGDRVVIKPVEREERTKSGIVLPDTAKEKPQEGMVEAIGNGRFIEATGKREPLDVKVGDRVVYAKYAGSEIKLDETEYLIVSEKDILAVVANGKKEPGEESTEASLGAGFLCLRGRVGLGGFRPRDHRQTQHGLGHGGVLILTAPVVVRVAPADIAAIVDEKQRSLRDAALLVEDPIAAGNSLVPVREERKGQVAQALRVGLVRPDVVDADGEHLGLPFDELVVITSQGGELIRSTRTEVEDIEADEDMLASAER